MVVRYSNLKEEVGDSIPVCETSYILGINLPSGQPPPVRWRWPVIGLLSPKKQMHDGGEHVVPVKESIYMQHKRN